ncbi:MAG: hypothetical protein MUC92_00610 [Fimbriimonadaceae bacterium]|jgi:glucose-6-phosphate isomerase|nr:hypothetical protein [Fimbriimonadaceae bacterium]
MVRLWGFEIDESSGSFIGADVVGKEVRASSLVAYFPSLSPDDDRVVYQTETALARDDNGLHVATTLLFPGTFAGNFSMTRGHFHVDPTLGEEMVVLSGRGELWLKSREGEVTRLSLSAGEEFSIPGHLAHRAVNPHEVPFVFAVRWDDRCGHDYESILNEGFGAR